MYVDLDAITHFIEVILRQFELLPNRQTDLHKRQNIVELRIKIGLLNQVILNVRRCCFLTEKVRVKRMHTRWAL
ncbi:hypothetical protein D3C76_1794310 [compost metagenome]